jgi:BirA family biotin operon repressor/biotin-[acetyl-CoA-carboxylase] ligase
MTDLRRSVLNLLAAGEALPRSTLAERLGVSIERIDHALESLRAWAVPLEFSPSAVGCTRALDLLDPAVIDAALSDQARTCIDRVEVFDELVSTNAHLLAEDDLPLGRARVCLAEYQSAGRGRRGRRWLQPFASGICLSLAWCFPGTPPALGALSLAAGVAVLRALTRFGVRDLALKWPNDILKSGHKLGGLLCELRLGPQGMAYVVIGVGLNVVVSPAVADEVMALGGVRPADLVDGQVAPSRSRLAAALAEELLVALQVFEAEGFAPFYEEWSRYDAFVGRPVVVRTADAIQEGVARGIAGDGSLRLEHEGHVLLLNAGDVSVRAPT